MRTVLWAGALLALLVALSTTAIRELRGRSPDSVASAGDLEIAVEWVGGGSLASAAGVWRETYRVANLGGVASGPLQLRVRTPLGLASESALATDLEPGGELHGSIEIALRPGLSELCIDVRALDGERTRPDADPSNNRVCRRISRRHDARASHPVSLQPEDTP